jgi:hypothetical protein
MVLPWRAWPDAALHTGCAPGPRQPNDRSERGTSVQPLVRQYLAYREGRLDGIEHSTAEAADRFGLDPAFAGAIDEYLAAYLRLRIQRTGWRASLIRAR